MPGIKPRTVDSIHGIKSTVFELLTFSFWFLYKVDYFINCFNIKYISINYFLQEELSPAIGSHLTVGAVQPFVRGKSYRPIVFNPSANKVAQIASS